jgi:hypothetical protein
MRNKFKEFYKATQEEVTELWENSFLSFDANVLLNLYRYTENSRNEIIGTFEYLTSKGRLWISYQAAFEYQKNRLTVISALKNTYDDLIHTLDKKSNEFSNELNLYKRHPYLKIEDLKSKVSESINDINSDLKTLKESHPDFFEDDPIFDILTKIFDDIIGNPLSTEELKLIFNEGKERYEKKVPPGYMDKEKEKNGEQSLYGDLIIWKELIKKTKELRKDLIFVTDDLKEDWWYIFNGKTIYPRPELIREFRKETGQEIMIYKPEQFLQYFNSNLKKQVKEETLKEVVETRKIDELSFDSLKVFQDKVAFNEEALRRLQEQAALWQDNTIKWRPNLDLANNLNELKERQHFLNEEALRRLQEQAALWQDNTIKWRPNLDLANNLNNQTSINPKTEEHIDKSPRANSKKQTKGNNKSK